MDRLKCVLCQRKAVLLSKKEALERDTPTSPVIDVLNLRIQRIEEQIENLNNNNNNKRTNKSS